MSNLTPVIDNVAPRSPSVCQPIHDLHLPMLVNCTSHEQPSIALRPGFIEPVSVARGSDFVCEGDIVLGSESSCVSLGTDVSGDAVLSIAATRAFDDVLPALRDLSNWPNQSTTIDPNTFPQAKERNLAAPILVEPSSKLDPSPLIPRRIERKNPPHLRCTPLLRLPEGNSRGVTPRTAGGRRAADDLVLSALQSLRRAEETVRLCGGRVGAPAAWLPADGEREPLLCRAAAVAPAKPPKPGEAAAAAADGAGAKAAWDSGLDSRRSLHHAARRPSMRDLMRRSASFSSRGERRPAPATSGEPLRLVYPLVLPADAPLSTAAHASRRCAPRGRLERCGTPPRQ